MADTATVEPKQAPATTDSGGEDTAEYTLQPAQDTIPEPAAETPSRPRGKTQAVPLIIHGTNAAGIGIGASYAAAGVPGLVAATAAGMAVGAAALVGRKRSRTSAARRSARGAAANRPTGGGGRRGGGPGFGGGRGGLLRGARGGRTNRPGSTHGSIGPSGRGRGGKNGSNPWGGSGPGAGRRSGPGATGGGKVNLGKGRLSGGGATSPGANTPKKGGGKSGHGNGSGKPTLRGRAWQGIKSAAGKMRRNNGPAAGGSGPGSGSGKAAGSGKTKPGTGTGAATSRAGRLLQKAKAWAGKLRRNKNGAAGSAGSGKPGTTGATATSGRLYRLRRLFLRKISHWARCAGAGLLAGLGALLTLPLGIAWGILRTVTRHRDPLHAFAFPVRIAGRIWRYFFRRSKARHDKEAKADQLTLTVNDPRKDTDPVSGPSLTAGTAVLDGNNSKFALAMRAAHSTYTGYSPRSMMEVAAEYAGLPNGIRATASAVQQMAVNSDQKRPCSKRAIAKLAEAAQRMVNAAARADGMVELFRTAHKFDIERILNPRTNEWMWNVTPTGSSAPEGAMFMPGRIEAGCVLMAVLYRTFEPIHMMQVGSEYQGMGMGLVALADAIAVLHQRTRDLYPVDDRVTDELGTITQMIHAAADDAALAAKLFLEDHHLEISHNTNPRKGPAAESMWNTPR